MFYLFRDNGIQAKIYQLIQTVNENRRPWAKKMY